MSKLKGIENERALLEFVAREKVVREVEAAAFLGMQETVIARVARRLELAGWITRTRGVTSVNDKKERKRMGMARTFLRLTSSGAAHVECGESTEAQPTSAAWQHNALAIRSLIMIRDGYFGGHGQIVTQAQMLSLAKSGKLKIAGKYPDGLLLGVGTEVFFEQEYSRKTGPRLRRQIEAMIYHAKLGHQVIVSYPYPAKNCEGIDHELRLGNAFRAQWGPAPAPNVKFLRVVFANADDFRNARVQKFEPVSLPDAVYTPTGTESHLAALPNVKTGQVYGPRWGDRTELKPANLSWWRVIKDEVIFRDKNATSGEESEYTRWALFSVFDGEYGYSVLVDEMQMDGIIETVAGMLKRDPSQIQTIHPHVSQPGVSFEAFLDYQKRREMCWILSNLAKSPK